MRKTIIIVALLSLFLIALNETVQFFLPVVFTAKEVEIHVAKGSTFKKAVQELSLAAPAGDFTLLYYIGLYRGLEKSLKPGYYLFTSGMAPYKILLKLLRGDIVRYKIAIVPGFTLWEVAARLAEKNIAIADEVLSLTHSSVLLGTLHVDAPSLEGYLHPATYLIDKGASLNETLAMMVNTQRKKYPAGFYERASALGMTENQVLTLASIIEREAAKDFERPLISGVYHNRLRTNMRLQADPTAIYGVKRYREGVKKADLENNTPYNTYRITGLPPGPIAIISTGSIEAALSPAAVDYLYFVSKGDGTHQFSVTLEEHNNAIRQVRKKK